MKKNIENLVIAREKLDEVYLKLIISIGLMPDELLRPLLDDLRSVNWPDCHFEPMTTKAELEQLVGKSSKI